MADSILKKHQLDITVGVELNDAQRKATSTQIKNMASQWQDMLDDAIKKGIEDGARSASLKDVLTQFNSQLKAFKLEPLTITVDELQIMDKPIEHAAKLVIEKLGNSFKGGGLGNIISSEITDSLNTLGGTVDKIYQKMEQGAKKAATNIAKSMEEIEKAAEKYSAPSALKQIRNTVSKAPTVSKSSDTRKSDFNNLYSTSKTLAESDSPWVEKYSADVKFVKGFQRLTEQQKTEVYGKNLAEVQAYYKKLEAVHSEKLIALNNILAQNGFADYKGNQYPFKGGEPWAREKTLQEVKQILSGGLTVKGDTSSGDSGKEQPNLNTQKPSETQAPKVTPQEKPKVEPPSPKKDEVKIDTNAFNQVLFDAIEKLSVKLQGLYKQMFADDIGDEEFDKIADNMSALIKNFASQFNFDNPKKIISYLQEKSDDMVDWDSKKIHKTLSKNLNPKDPSWSRVETPVIEDNKPEIIEQKADAHKEVAAAIGAENRALEKKAQLIQLINTLSKSDNQKEKFAYLNTQTGEASEYIEGQYNSVSGKDIDNLRQKDSRDFDSTIHTHPYHIAAPSPEDLKATYVKKHDEFKTHFIQAIDEVFAIDFSALTQDQVQEIYKQYKQNVKDFEAPDIVSYRDLGVDSVDVDAIMQAIKEDLLSLYPELQASINSYIADIKHTFQQDDLLSMDTQDARGTFDDKAAGHFRDITDDDGMEIAGRASQLFEIATGEADAYQLKLKGLFEQTIRDLGHDVSQITKTYSVQDFIQHNQPNLDGSNIETVDKSNIKSSTSDTDYTILTNLNTTLSNLVTALNNEKSDVKVSIDATELSGILHDGKPYVVDINGQSADSEGNKIAIDTEGLKNVLSGIVFKVQDASEKEPANSAIDQESINNLVGAIKTAVTPQSDNIPADSGPWAKEETLRNITGSTLGKIANSIPKVDTKNLAKNDILNRVAQATEAINGKISGKITGSIEDIVKSDKAEKDAKKSQESQEREAAVKQLTDEYKELGKLRAQRDAMPNSTERVKLQQEIKSKGAKLRRKGISLGVDSAEMKQIAGTAQAEEAEAIATKKAEKEKAIAAKQHAQAYDELIEKIKKRNELQEQSAGLDEKSNVVKGNKPRIDALNAEIESRQKNLELTEEELAAIDKLNTQSGDTVRHKQNKKQDRDDAKAFREELKQMRKQNNVNVADSRYNAGLKELNDLWVLDDNIDPSMLPEVVELQAALKGLKADYDNVNQAMLRGDAVSNEEIISLNKASDAVAEKTAKLKEMLDHYKKFGGGENIGTYVSGIGSEEDQIRHAVDQQFGGKAKIKSFNRDASGFLTANVQVKEGARTFTEYSIAVEKADRSIRMLKGNTKQLPGFLDGVKKKLGEISQYFSAMSVISRATQELRKGIQYVRDIDLALTELKKVTDETEESYERFLDTASKTAAKVGSTIKDVISSTADWARLGSVLAKTSISPLI